ncbi:cobyric acid synthase [Corynebacterium choanae]|uniref:Cobyric acid synthase n=1 Tax=Corynebacterium choanae TaxID=1862358 RepID=A0A3G6J7U0_9CORY|nr:cobyric acid synthase [Corynebacterium choanae]AZA13843.1 Cobyric acid synthase [Corynebacterium choanae]
MTAVLVAGTTSDAGKSVIVAGLCRAFTRRGIRVAPFKAQNMSNNSAVCPAGGEIGRAQALQAAACGLEPSVEFNPILLKPGSDRQSQLVVQGIAAGQVSARSYIHHRSHLRQLAGQALRDLEARFDVVIVEGAGSPAEINLRETDVANFGLLDAAGAMPVLLVGDIDRGGVLAHFYGTATIVDPADAAHIAGFIVNKFRGDATILQPGLDTLTQRLSIPTLGVVPYIPGLWIDAEDSLQSQLGNTIGPGLPPLGSAMLDIAAIRLPRISNATDVEALAVEPGVRVRWVDDPASVRQADLLVLPGSKATVADLRWLRERKLDEAIVYRAEQQLPVLGICGGFQMLCRSIIDPVEAGVATAVEGLGVFACDIEFGEEKILQRYESGAYEIHHGREVNNTETPWPFGTHGAVTGASFGTHLHGLCEDDEFRRSFLATIAACCGKQDSFIVADNTSFAAAREAQLDIIADTLEAALNLDALIAMITEYPRP